MAKMTRKELLNAQDDFVTTTGTIVTLIKKNPLRLAAVAAIIIVLITSGTGFYYWKSNRERSAMLAYNNAYNNSQMTLQVIQDYADTKAGKLSRLRMADLAYSKADYSMALNYGNDFINTWGHEDIFYWDGIITIAASYMELGEKEKGLPLLDDCIKSAPEYIQDQALFYKAQALIALGKNDDAKQSLMKISEQNKDIAEISLALIDKNTGETTDAKQ